MNKTKGFFPILIPSITVFISSFCIMVLELVASRLIAKHLGSSLYTWTAVIGVVLAGITIGNYLGGRIADRFKPHKSLAILFALASISCVVIIILNNLVGQWVWLWKFSWPVRTFSHVSLVFLLPSVLLGTVSPVVAKMALDLGLATGRTVGDIYAWGAAGSIAGTFAAGYYLISAIGTVAIIWAVGAVLLVMAILYWARFYVLYIWAALFICVMLIGTSQTSWAQSTGSSFALRQKPDPTILYEDESQYCYIAVKRTSETSDKAAFMQDKLMHSQMILGDYLDLQYSYSKIYSALTERLSEGKQDLRFLVIGGGGYVVPRYVERKWPDSQIDVVEIDPGVTAAAIEGFGPVGPSVRTVTMDARNYVDELLRESKQTGQLVQYDFIYEDALTDYSVPWQLTTKEFNDKLVKILSPEGGYMIEMIDVYDSGLFLAAMVNTLEQTFNYVYVLTDANWPHSQRNTFVVFACMNPFDFEKELIYHGRPLPVWLLSDDEINYLKEKNNGLILMDNYAPVENLLAPTVRLSAVGFLVEKHTKEAKELLQNGQPDEAVVKYETIIKLNPTLSIQTYNDIGLIMASQGKYDKAVQAFSEAVLYNEERASTKENIANIYYNLGIVLNKLNRIQQAAQEFQEAAEGYRLIVDKDPLSAKMTVRLGDTLAELGNLAEAALYFKKAVDLEPSSVENWVKLIQAFEFQGRYDEAIEIAKKAIETFLQHGREDVAAQLREYTKSIEHKKLNGPGSAN